MEQKYLSFLYPDRAHEEAAETAPVRISAEVTEELGLASLFSLKNSTLSAFFTRDPEVIAYRQAVFADLARLPELSARGKKNAEQFKSSMERMTLEEKREFADMLFETIMAE